MTLHEKVKSIIVEQLGVDEHQISRDSHIIDDLGADSLDAVELVMAFEEEFGAAIPEEDAERLLTVGAIERYLQAHGLGQGADIEDSGDGLDVTRRIGGNSVVFVSIEE